MKEDPVTRKKSVLVVLLAALIASTVASVAFAQQSAQVTGLITDTSGALVQGAQITAINDDTGIRTTTASNEAGTYTIPSIPPGSYRVEVTKTGFRTTSRGGITLAVAQAVQLNLQLEVGAVSETVNVTATAPLLDASSNVIGGVLTTEKIENEPVKGRNSNAFMLLEPGARVPRVTTNQPVLESHYQFFSINGGLPYQNLFLLDGANNNNVEFNGPEYTPPVDSLEEYRVQTSNYSAQYGGAAGGVINTVTKGGTNTFHGTLFEFFRNTNLQANNFFYNSAGLPRAPFHQNQFGGNFGGPLKKDRLFFFGSYEGLRLRLPAGGATSAGGLPNIITVPTALQKQGDFSRTFTSTGGLIGIYDPFSTVPDPNSPGNYIRTQFPGNAIPASRINPISAAIATYWPNPITSGAPFTNANNFPFNGSQPETINDFSIRIDYQLNNSTSILGRYSESLLNITLPNVFGGNNIADPYNSSTDEHHVSSVIKVIKTFSPSVVGEFTASWNRFLYFRNSVAKGFDLTKLGFPSYMATQASLVGFPSIAIAGLGATQSGVTATSIGSYYAGHDGTDYPEFRADLTKLAGKLTLKFGGLAGFARLQDVQFSNNTGAYTFDKTFTQGPNPLLSGPQSGVGFATFLLGTPTAGSYRPTTADTSDITKIVGVYVQSDYKATRRLLLNVGLRWDHEIPRTERYNRVSNFDFTGHTVLPNGVPITGGLAFPGVGGFSRGQWDSQRTNFGPRIGLAYNLSDATVIRAGYGLFYGNTRGFAAFPPNTGFGCSTPVTTSLNNGLTPAASLSNLFPNGFCTPSGSTLGLLTSLGQAVTVIDRNLKMLYQESWSLDIQRRLPLDLLFEVTYAGNRGINLPTATSVNQLDPKYLSLGNQLNNSVPNPFYGVITQGPLSGPTIPLAQSLLPYPQFINVTSQRNTYGASTYHALYAKLEKRFSKGFTFLASYTYSKVITDAAIGFAGESFVSGTPQNYYNLRGERSIAGFNTPQTLVISYVYELPFGPGKPFLNGGGLAGKIIGGWQINGITTFQSGEPLQISGGNASALNVGLQRPNWNGQNPTLSGAIQPRLSRYFDTSDFPLNAPFTLGNAPRIMPNLYGPGTKNFDISMFKDTKFGERLTLQFRAEAFNSFNRVQFANPNVTATSVTFGVINAQANAPRDFQLAMKLRF